MFIACVEKKHKDTCFRLSHLGRDPITSIVVQDVWDSTEVIENLQQLDFEISEQLQDIVESTKTKFYFCKCSMEIRNIQPKGPPR